MDFLKSDSFRRILAGLVGVLLPILNSKLGLNIPQEQVVAALGVVALYIAQSTANAMHARAVEAKRVTSTDQAVAVLAAAAGAPAVAPVVVVNQP